MDELVEIKNQRLLVGYPQKIGKGRNGSVEGREDGVGRTGKQFVLIYKQGKRQRIPARRENNRARKMDRQMV